MQACDSGSPQKCITANVQIAVRTIPGNLPSFSLTNYDTTIADTTLVNAFILQVSAVDRDLPLGVCRNTGDDSINSRQF